jgi:hypothetical protein
MGIIKLKHIISPNNSLDNEKIQINNEHYSFRDNTNVSACFLKPAVDSSYDCCIYIYWWCYHLIWCSIRETARFRVCWVAVEFYKARNEQSWLLFDHVMSDNHGKVPRHKQYSESSPQRTAWSRAALLENVQEQFSNYK